MLGLEGLQLTGPRIPLFMPARKKWFALPLFSRGRSRARLIRGRPRDLRVVHRFPLPLIRLFHSSTLRSAFSFSRRSSREKRQQQGSVPGDLISSRKFVIAARGAAGFRMLELIEAMTADHTAAEDVGGRGREVMAPHGLYSKFGAVCWIRVVHLVSRSAFWLWNLEGGRKNCGCLRELSLGGKRRR